MLAPLVVAWRPVIVALPLGSSIAASLRAVLSRPGLVGHVEQRRFWLEPLILRGSGHRFAASVRQSFGLRRASVYLSPLREHLVPAEPHGHLGLSGQQVPVYLA